MNNRMEMIELATSGRRTTRVGFGCSSLMGAMGRKESLALLECAFDEGVRHFDVAPMYGFGAAEGCLGEFLARHRGELTVTTKYGIPPAKNQALLGVARAMAGRIVRAVPMIRKRLGQVAGKVARPGERSNFTAAEAEASLRHSLAELRAERIDVWLLHDVEVEDLKDDSLLRFMEASVTAGKVGVFGVGTGAAAIAGLAARHSAYCGVQQFEWSILDEALPESAAFRIHHRSLTDRFRQLNDALVSEPAMCKAWSERIGADLAEDGMLAALMLRGSMVFNPGSIVLFSSKKASHIRKNVVHANDATLDSAARRLHELVRAHKPFQGIGLPEAR